MAVVVFERTQVRLACVHHIRHSAVLRGHDSSTAQATMTALSMTQLGFGSLIAVAPHAQGHAHSCANCGTAARARLGWGGWKSDFPTLVLVSTCPCAAAARRGLTSGGWLPPAPPSKDDRPAGSGFSKRSGDCHDRHRCGTAGILNFFLSTSARAPSATRESADSLASLTAVLLLDTGREGLHDKRCLVGLVY